MPLQQQLTSAPADCVTRQDGASELASAEMGLGPDSTEVLASLLHHLPPPEEGDGQDE